MFKNRVSGYDVKVRCKELGAKHIVYGVVYNDYFGQLAIQHDDIDNLSKVFYDDSSFNAWVDDTKKKFDEYGCTNVVFYAVHNN